MSNETFNKETIIKYLLGGAAGLDVERLDELTFTDAEFAEHLKLIEDELVDSYVSGKLRAEDRAAFESYYLASPLRREKVHFSKTFQGFVDRQTASIATLVPLIGTLNPTPKRTFADLFSQWQRAFQFAAAIAVIAVIGICTWIAFRNSVPPDDQLSKIETGITGDERRTEISPQKTKSPPANIVEKTNVKLEPTPKNGRTTRPIANSSRPDEVRVSPPAASDPIAPPDKSIGPPPPTTGQPRVVALVLPIPVRGSNSLRELKLSDASVTAYITLELEPGKFSSYHVSLRGPSGAAVWQKRSLTPAIIGDQKTIGLNIPASKLRSGIYSLSVSAGDGNAAEIIGDYAFRVVR